MISLRRAVHTYAQCGGEGGSCKGADCKDAAWTDVACLSYDVCTRVNHWWWCAPLHAWLVLLHSKQSSANVQMADGAL